MIYRLSDNIISPLGTTTADNYQAVKARRSAVHRYDSRWNVREPFAAALFSDEQNRQLAVKGLTRFESLAFRSAQQAIRESGIDVSSSRALFILSTTKANIELLGRDADDGVLSPADAAKRVAERLGFSTEPLVVCNACISGAAAIITALRLLDAALYDYAVICGADVQSEFTVSGFQSLKAVSPDECRPFDIERIGLNLGEAAATLVVASHPTPENISLSSLLSPLSSKSWAIVKGSIHNDAFHISSPSKDGHGALLALEDVLSGVDTDDLAVVNAHGTATMFNDQMESVAIERAGLNTVNVNALKGYFAHTLGAAGLLETIMTMASLDDGLILATRGYGELGVSGKIHLSSEHRPTSKTSFIKMISGFGGGNAALYVKQTSRSPVPPCPRTPVPPSPRPPVKRHTLKLTPTSLTIDAQSVNVEKERADLLTSLYKQYVHDYPKYYKMDGLCRLGFIAAELLVKQENSSLLSPPSSLPRNRAVILFNHSSSIAVDRRYFDTIADKNDYFPSPSAFVYTLPNIVTGEIAIRHHYHGETSFYITDRHDSRREWQILCASMADPVTNSAIAGWIDYVDDHHFEADMYIVERQIIENVKP